MISGNAFENARIQYCMRCFYEFLRLSRLKGPLFGCRIPERLRQRCHNASNISIFDKTLRSNYLAGNWIFSHEPHQSICVCTFFFRYRSKFLISSVKLEDVSQTCVQIRNFFVVKMRPDKCVKSCNIFAVFHTYVIFKWLKQTFFYSCKYLYDFNYLHVRKFDIDFLYEAGQTVKI